MRLTDLRNAARATLTTATTTAKSLRPQAPKPAAPPPDRFEVGVRGRDGFAGLRGSVKAGAGQIAANVFGGLEGRLERNKHLGPADLTGKVAARAGVLASFEGAISSLGVSLKQAGEVGVGARGSLEARLGRSVTELAGWVFVGAAEHLRARAGASGVGAGVEAFVGGRLGGSVGQSFDAPGLKAWQARGELLVGVGARADVDVRVDSRARTVGAGFDLGCALGIGAGFGGDVSVGL